MQELWNVDFVDLFTPTVSIPEIFIRGTVMYLLVWVLMRLFRRESGTLTTADLLVVVFVADAAQNAMASTQRSLTDGALLVVTIYAWNVAFDWLSYRYAWAYKLINPRPLPLISNGRIQWHNLRKQLFTKADLMEQLREHGIESVKQVQSCHIESDGKISVIERKQSAEH